MSDIVFSYWNGEVVDNRKKTGQKAARPKRLKLPAEFKPGQPIAAFMGWGGLAIRDKKVSVVDLCRAYLKAIQGVSCGKCFPCRVGTRVLVETLERITQGKGRMQDIAQLQDLGSTIVAASKCQVGQTGPLPLLAALKHFRREFENVIQHKTKAPARAVPAQADCPVRQRLPGAPRHPHLYRTDRRRGL